jgi:hypothetical protein
MNERTASVGKSARAAQIPKLTVRLSSTSRPTSVVTASRSCRCRELLDGPGAEVAQQDLAGGLVEGEVTGEQADRDGADHGSRTGTCVPDRPRTSTTTSVAA